MTDDFNNHVVYEGWVLECIHRPPVEEGVQRPCDPIGRRSKEHYYSLKVGVGQGEPVLEVMAFRSVASERLKKGAAVRVTGKLIQALTYFDVANGERKYIEHIKVHADKVEVL